MEKLENFGIPIDPDAEKVEIISGRKEPNEFNDINSCERIFNGALEILRMKYKSEFNSKFKEIFSNSKFKDEISLKIRKGMSIAEKTSIEKKEKEMAIAAARCIEEKIMPRS